MNIHDVDDFLIIIHYFRMILTILVINTPKNGQQAPTAMFISLFYSFIIFCPCRGTWQFIVIIITMIADKHRYEVDSSSTQERERRFSRRSAGKHSRSKSNNSDTSSISKFFIRNLQHPQKTNACHELIRKPVNATPKWSPPRREATPHKTMREKQINLSKEELLQEQSRDLNFLRAEIEKYRIHVKKQTTENASLVMQNGQLREKILMLEGELETQRRACHTFRIQTEELSNKCLHKEKMLHYYEKDQTSLKKIKNSIFQSRIEQFQKQRQELNIKILQLEETVEDLRAKNCTFSPGSSSFLDITIESHQAPKQFEDQYTRTLESQLYQSKEQIKRLNIHINCQQRNFFKEMSVLKRIKEKDYNELKDKFADFLKKYKDLMKKFTSSQVRSLVEGKKAKQARQKSSESLVLSSDEESISTNVIQ